MIYGDVCAGISAPTVAWHPLGWRPAFFSEIAPFPRAVLEHRWPSVPVHGDFSTINEGDYEPIDLLVGGTPCQDFSLAGRRAGLDGDRGNLTLQFLALAGRLRPQWVVWENVPGVLSSNTGRDFGAFLGGLGQLGYGWAYRVLDAQYFGVPQRRRRVFVVGYLGDSRCAAAVLFERESLRRNPPPRREAGQEVAGTLTINATGGGGPGSGTDGAVSGYLQPVAVGGVNTSGPINVATTLNACSSSSGRQDFATETFVVHGSQDPDVLTDCAHTLGRNQGQENAVFTLSIRGRDEGSNFEFRSDGTANALLTPNGGRGGIGVGAIATPSAVRRLTPRECERLQGFPDDYTKIPVRIYKSRPRSKHFARYPDLYATNPDGAWTRFAADSPRYSAIGNSMAVPVMRFIGARIKAVEMIASAMAEAAQ